MAEAPTIVEIATELCALPPEDFVAARNARAKSIDDAGLAAAVRALRKPQLVAWVVNVLASEDADALGEALRLADELRAAQDDLDAAALARLGRERRALIGALARRAASLAEAHGRALSPAAVEAVEQTLNAAMRDAGAAAAVASGRLVRPLEASGMDDVDIADAVAGPLDVARPAASAPPGDELKARRERRDAERAVREAERDAAHAEREQIRLDERWRAARERGVLLEERIAALEADLARVHADSAAQQEEIAALAAERTHAGERAAAARRAADRAQAQLDG